MITLTESAKQRVEQILLKEGDGYRLRMYVYGKGCAGLTYGFGITDELEDDDTIFEQGPVEVVVDSDSLPYLNGSVVDFVESMTGSRFNIENPNAKSQCGCGDSFNPI